MHGVNTKYFGSATGQIEITYHNGSDTVDGYIVKQIGDRRFKVTTDGSTFYKVYLADNTTLAETLTAGFATITCTKHGGGTEHISMIHDKIAFTTEGSRFHWKTVATTGAGQCLINLI